MLARIQIVLAAALLVSACAEPPNKEMDQAQGAIDAARAAGADEYATQQLSDAVTTLKQSRDAVAQGDYRSALSYALESRDRAQNAAKEASEQRAAVRGQVEQALDDLNALLARADRRVTLAESNRAPRRTITATKNVLAPARATVQKARAAVARGEYAAARRMLDGVEDRVTAAITEIEAATPARPARSRR
jgi:predicted S18 family serine protease